MRDRGELREETEIRDQGELGEERALARQAILAALLKIRVGRGISVVVVLGIVEVVGIVGGFLDLANVTRVGRAGTLELARGTLEALLNAGLEKLELIRVLCDVVGHGDMFLETMALGGVGMTVADGTWGGGSRTGGVGRHFRGELVDKEVDGGVEIVVGGSVVRKRDVTNFAMGVLGAVAVAIAVAIGGVSVAIAVAVRRVAIAVWGLIAPVGFLDDGLGGTSEVEVVRESGPDEFGGEFPTQFGVLPVVIELLGEPIGVERVGDDKIEAVLATTGALFTVLKVEEIEATLGELQDRFVVLLAGSRGSEGAGTMGQLGVDVL
jgi:hypothetical protein